MSPTPPQHSNFADNFRFRSRRQRYANPYGPTTNATPTQTQIHAQPPVTPLVAEDHGDGGSAGDEASDAEVEDEDIEDIEADIDEHHDAEEEEGGIEEVPMDIDPAFDPAELGLKEIGNLASWTVSSCKPGCGVDELRDEDTNLFWQSDGPQPHHLNIHFSRLVLIRAIRIYLDFQADESYTPTRITLLAGTGYHDLIPFSTLEFAQPKGWIDVSLDNVGGGKDGKTLRAFLVQVRVMENHQNGKDTHVRGLKVYAKDERLGGGGLGVLDKIEGRGRTAREAQIHGAERTTLIEPDWMGDAEIR